MIFSIRIPENMLGHLKEIAKQQHMPPNALINQILRNSVDWEYYAIKGGMIHILRETISALFDMITKEQSDRLVKENVEYLVEFITLLRKKFNAESALSAFEGWLKSNSFSYRKEFDDSTLTFIIKFVMGTKFVKQVKQVFTLIMEKLEVKVIESKVTRGTLFIKMISPLEEKS